ncbi:hypothetical protein J437_LFUL010776 [Ladona fulva]|uniref:C2 domain-containing protein n=1 Tax=Ladona fulva TaxID=123851 RepID=A0A8K0P073_LADFU|nr:hypothetical protein J437_LFUL010776 [Ladona fulva]
MVFSRNQGQYSTFSLDDKSSSDGCCGCCPCCPRKKKRKKRPADLPPLIIGRKISSQKEQGSSPVPLIRVDHVEGYTRVPVKPRRPSSSSSLGSPEYIRPQFRKLSMQDDAISMSENIGKGSTQPAGNITPTAGSAPPTPGGGKKVSTGSSVGSWTTTPPTSPAVIAGGHNANEDETSNERVPNIHQQSTTLSSLGNIGKGSTQPAGNITPTAGSAPPTPGGGKKVSTGSSVGSWTTTPPTSPAVIAGGHNANEDETSNERVPNIHQQSTTLSSLGLRSDSMASVYSGAGEGRYGTVAVRGEVEFALQYNYKQGALEILVKQCKELAPVDTKRNRSDPYVKVYLLPDKSKSGKRKTKVKKHTLNPVFDETLKFHITLNGLETRTLWLTVWHSDMFGRNDFLGEVMMSLENKVFDDPTPKWYPLQERTEPFDDLLCYKGEMIVGLKFVPPDVTNLHKKGRLSRGSLHVLVKDAKNLTAVKTNGTSDPFCKSYLLPDKGRSSKQKTGVCRRTINPVWNHTFVYEDVSLQELSERSLELTVWDHDRLASNEFLGGLRFNLGTGKHYGKSVDWMDATGREMTLWQSMLGRANFWVEGCLTLRPTLDHRSSPSSTLAS